MLITSAYDSIHLYAATASKRTVRVPVGGGGSAFEFVHLHVHSMYSLLDGCADVEEIVRRSADLGMSSVALTDHGVLHGVVQFSKAASHFGVKPIIGVELNLVAENEGADSTSAISHHHLTVLAKNQQGYRNLAALTSRSFLSGASEAPVVTKEQLASMSDGLIVLSGCSSGEVSTLIDREAYSQARKVAAWYKQVFGPDYFLELIDHGLANQKRINEELLRLHRDLDIGVVATNDVHYLSRDDVEVQDVLHCIHSGTRLDDPHRPRIKTDQRYLKSPQEMAEIWGHIPEALTNSLAIAERCSFDLQQLSVQLPVFQPIEPGPSGMALLHKLVHKGLQHRYGSVPPEKARERADYELKVIGETGFTDYFLIVWDLVQFARRNHIPIGPGRGSAASSIVAYALEITDVNPLEHGLVFERFLNPERVTMPDIDIDFCYERRPEVIHYASQRYGTDRVAQIATFGTLTARAAIRDVGRVLGMSQSDVNKIAQLIPSGPGTTLQEALRAIPQLQAMADNDPQIARLFRISRRVEGVPRHLSVHAAGIIIAPEPLTALVPLCKTADDVVVTQLIGEDLESLGFLKMDLLGLRTLTVLDQAIQLIAQKGGPHPDVRQLPLDDRRVYEMLCRGESEGVFQLETGMFQQLLRRVKPRNFDDIVAILSLGRPGPMTRLDDYLRYRGGQEAPRYPHSALEPILAETSGVMLYQEQVMRIATEVAGYSAGEADLLRRAISQSAPAVIQGERERFLAAALGRGMDEKQAAEIFEGIVRFAKYGFPKSHSVAYAYLAYATAYLKAYFPQQFMAALLNSVMGNLDRIGRYIRECRRLTIAVKGPDVNASAADFTVDTDGSIRYGLGAVKYVGKSLASKIEAARKTDPYQSVGDFVRRTAGNHINRKAIECLARVDAFSSLRLTRVEAMGQIESLLAQGSRVVDSQQSSLFPQEAVPERSRVDDVVSLLQDEVELLGTYVSSNPLAPYQEILSSLQRFEPNDFSMNVIGGVVLSVLDRRTKTGLPMAIVGFEDTTGRQYTLILFPELYNQLSELSPGHVMLVKGRIEADGDRTRLLAAEVRMLEGTPLEIDVFDLSALEDWRRVLRRYPGNRPVIMCVHGTGLKARLVLPPRYWVHQDFDVASKEHPTS